MSAIGCHYFLPPLKSELFAISHSHWILCLDAMKHQELRTNRIHTDLEKSWNLILVLENSWNSKKCNFSLNCLAISKNLLDNHKKSLKANF